MGDLLDDQGNVIRRGQVRFAEIEFAYNAKLCRDLGVKRLPYIHMYRGADGLLEEFACGPKDFNTKVVEKIEQYLAQTARGESRLGQELKDLMEAGQEDLGNEVLRKLFDSQEYRAHHE